MGPDGGAPDWSKDSRFVGLTLGAAHGGLYIAFNSGHLPLTAVLPEWPGRSWRPLIDTGKVTQLRTVKHGSSVTGRPVWAGRAKALVSTYRGWPLRRAPVCCCRHTWCI